LYEVKICIRVRLWRGRDSGILKKSLKMGYFHPIWAAGLMWKISDPTQNFFCKISNTQEITIPQSHLLNHPLYIYNRQSRPFPPKKIAVYINSGNLPRIYTSILYHIDTSSLVMKLSFIFQQFYSYQDMFCTTKYY